MKRILLVGGGSGGHVFPLIAVAEAARQLDPGVELMILGGGPFLKDAAAAAALPYKRILAGKLRRYFSLQILLDPFRAVAGFFQSLWHLFFYMPDAVFCKGGYASVMPALVAKLYFIPVYTHESDSVPGKANRFIGKLAKTVFTSFETAAASFKPGKAVLVGNPVRPELLAGNREAALQQFNLRSDRKTILIEGGSQGAKRINDAMLDALVQLVQQFQVIHQCGDSQFKAVQATVDQLSKEGEKSYGPVISANYRLYPFLAIQDLASAYALADVIVSRAGASALFEIASLGKPAVIIPITNSNGDHQMQNAMEFQKYGGVVIEEANITSHIIINQIEELMKPDVAAAVGAKLKTFAKPDAASAIASALLA